LELNKEDIEKIIPHRKQMLLVDKVQKIKYKKRKISAIKYLSENDPIFEGHFPDHPIYPGVLIVEGMVQTGAILGFLYNKSVPEDERLDIEDKLLYLINIDETKFVRAVEPKDTLEYRVKIKKITPSAITFKGTAYVDYLPVAVTKFRVLIMRKDACGF
jgi:3-hydroxyacyl-[acyl-carrier-protein] dehydratase